MTRLALAQWVHLAGELAATGIDLHVVVVADDDNLDIAREHGFATVELDNECGLGAKFNAGYQYAGSEGADWLVHIGSDDWIHPDVFVPLVAPLAPRPIVAGRRIAYVDLLRGRLQKAKHDGRYGTIPWIIPRHLLDRCGFSPIRPERRRGMDGEIVRGLRRAHAAAEAQWVFHDPHEVARVDFKSAVNLNDFGEVHGRLGGDPWAELARFYPSHLVELAIATHEQLAAEHAT